MNQMMVAEMIFHLMPLLDKKFVRPLEQQFKVVLSPLQVYVLAFLKEKKATMTELSEEMLVSKQQMTPIIDKLVSQGFVQREYDSNDRRIVQISITSTGLNMMESLKEKTMTILLEKLSHLNDEDVQRLIIATTELRQVVGKIP